MTPKPRKRILFIAEACTLAHVIRPLVLARALDPARYEVHFAYAQSDLMKGKAFIFAGTDFTHWDMQSQSAADFAKVLGNGKRLFEAETLAAYAKADIALIEKVRPDFVVGDMRWSLSTSAAVAGIPCAVIQNAYWSPYGDPVLFPLPEFPAIRRAVALLGEPIMSFIFKHISPFALKGHMRPINQLRRAHQLPLFDNFFAAVTAADYTLYADIPTLIPTKNLPPNHRYIGSITWAPENAPPAWWATLPTDRPIVYVALGSSGNAELLPSILNMLKQREVTVVLAGPAHYSADRIFAAPFLPYDEAAKRSVLMIGNGGSGAIYQAIQAEIPLLGIVSNQDQLMAMARAEAQGCAIMLRGSAANAASMGVAVDRLLSDASFKAASARLNKELASFNAAQNFVHLLDEVLGADAVATV